PINLGSSIGITKAVNRDELTNALDVATSFSQFVMVEHAILNLKEVNCSVLGDYEKAEASVCEEPVSSDKILSYNDKYASGGSKGSKGMSSLKRKIPAEITPEQEAKIKALAVDTFKALGCSGVSRIDFMIDLDNGNIYANEINTIPGSLSFYLWEPMGKPYKELINDLISLALKRERERKNLMFTYDSNIFKTSSFKGLGGAKGSKS
ncbi:MAG: D-alanine--D-alanine ligase, partial [Oscillospiraceae bacterium]|nr:D-alanine--D-alanine ligase [Oscillospiraceae bacterium]